MGDTRVDPRRGNCPDCGRRMVSQWAYSQDRTGWRARGFVQQKAHGKCQACYMRGYVSEKAPRPIDPATLARLRADVGLDAPAAWASAAAS